MSDTTYIIRPLGAIYGLLEPLTLPFLRVVTGLWLVPHGWGKLMGGMGGTAEFLGSVGFTPGWFCGAKGFLWSNGGWEYPAMWAALALVFVIRGGGFLSVDRAIGREF